MATEVLECMLDVVNGNTLEITPATAPADNSSYTIKIKGLKSKDGEKTFPTTSVKVITAMSPMYCTLASLRALVDNFGIPEEDLLSFIRDASKYADFVGQDNTTTTTDANDQFALEEFTRTKACLDCLLRGAMMKTMNGGGTYTLDVATLQDPTNATAFKNLLDDLRKALKEWQDAIRGYYNEGRAKPKATRIGTKSNTNSQIAHTTVDKILNDFTRTPPEGND